MRNSYIRARREKHAPSKFQDSTLNFIASEVDIKRKSKLKRKKKIVKTANRTKENVTISTIQTKNAIDEDDDSSEHDEEITFDIESVDQSDRSSSDESVEPEFKIDIIRTHPIDTSQKTDKTKLKVYGSQQENYKNTNKSHETEDQSRFSSDESVDFKIDIIESHPMDSSQETDETKTSESQPVNYNKPNRPRRLVHSIKFEEPEITDTQIHTNDISKLESIKSEPIDIPTEDVGCEPISTTKIQVPSGSNFIDTLPNFSNVNVKSEPMSIQTEDTPVLPCKDINQFLSDLSSYISSKFSKEKQEDIQLRICSLLTSEELEEFKQVMQAK